jgi:hypothetical protein
MLLIKKPKHHNTKAEREFKPTFYSIKNKGGDKGEIDKDTFTLPI